MSSPDRYPWTLHFVWKLLQNDPGTVGLLAHNPFSDEPPRFVRVVRYHYEFVPGDDPEGRWWRRSDPQPWIPALSATDARLRGFLVSQGWLGRDR